MRKTEKNTMEIERLLSIISIIVTIISWLGITSISVVFVFFQHGFRTADGALGINQFGRR